MGDLADKWRVLILGPMVSLKQGDVLGVLQITAELPLPILTGQQVCHALPGTSSFSSLQDCGATSAILFWVISSSLQARWVVQWDTSLMFENCLKLA